MHYYDPWFINDLYYEPPTYYRIPPPPPQTYYNRHPFYPNNNPPPYLPPPIPRRNLSLFSSVVYGTTNRGGIGDWSAGAGGGGGVNEEFRQRGNTIYVVRKRLRQKGKLTKKRYKPKLTRTAGRSYVGPPGNVQQGSVNSNPSRQSKDDDEEEEEEEYEDSEYEDDEDDDEEEEEYEVPYGTVDSSGRIHKLPTTN